MIADGGRQWWTMWLSTVVVGGGKWWRLATTDSDKRGGWRQLMVNGVGDGKRWWLATANNDRRDRQQRRRIVADEVCDIQLVEGNDGYQKRLAAVDSGLGGSQRQTVVDGSDE